MVPMALPSPLSAPHSSATDLGPGAGKEITAAAVVVITPTACATPVTATCPTNTPAPVGSARSAWVAGDENGSSAKIGQLLGTTGHAGRGCAMLGDDPPVELYRWLHDAHSRQPQGLRLR